MMVAALLFLGGLAASAFFSGSETGLYRVSRTRLVLDALAGSRLARGLVWLINHPSFFVATALVGNNLANYFTSLGVVVAVDMVFQAGGSAEWLVPMLVSPLVFVLGELVPKHLFFRAPYRLITLIRLPLLLAAALFSPVAMVLSYLGRLLQQITGQPAFRVSLMMGRGELDRVLKDGHEAGILEPGQRILATKLFEVGQRSAISFGVPVGRLATVETPIDIDAARHLARRHNHPIILVRREQTIIGFIWYADLCTQDPKYPIQPVVMGRTGERHLAMLLRMYDAGTDVAVLRDEKNQVRSVVTRRQLVQPLMKAV
ncbi:MAG: CNNM domain-containing protein [Planctomycetota bacterium]